MLYNVSELKIKEMICPMFKRLSALLIALVIFSGLTLVASAYDVGSVTASVLNVRSGAGTNYSIVGQLYSGQTVQINEYASNGWLKISFKNTTAYVSADYIAVRSNQTTSRSGSYKRDILADGVVTENLNLRSAPNTGAGVLKVIPKGTKIFVNADVGYGWSIVTYNGVIGYSSSQYITFDLAKAYTAPVANVSAGQQVVDYAKRFLGVPYVYGGNGPSSFDCSGFTKYVYAHFGYTLNRIAADQVKNGVYVDKSNLAPGDLILFANTSSGYIGHVGIYIGNDQFIHASTNSYEVRIDRLSGYYSTVYHSARRVL